MIKHRKVKDRAGIGPSGAFNITTSSVIKVSRLRRKGDLQRLGSKGSEGSREQRQLGGVGIIEATISNYVLEVVKITPVWPECTYLHQVRLMAPNIPY